VVLDGVIAIAANLDYLTEHGFDYVVNGKRTTRQKFTADFLELDRFHKVRESDDKVMHRLESEDEHVLLCRSGERKKKKDAIVSKTEEKFLAALEKLKLRAGKNDGKLHLAKWPETVNRTLEKNWTSGLSSAPSPRFPTGSTVSRRQTRRLSWGTTGGIQNQWTGTGCS